MIRFSIQQTGRRGHLVNSEIVNPATIVQIGGEALVDDARNHQSLSSFIEEKVERLFYGRMMRSVADDSSLS